MGKLVAVLAISFCSFGLFCGILMTIFGLIGLNAVLACFGIILLLFNGSITYLAMKVLSGNSDKD